jgi:hypothetical protein
VRGGGAVGWGSGSGSGREEKRREEKKVVLVGAGAPLEVIDGVVVLGGVKDRARTRDFFRAARKKLRP